MNLRSLLIGLSLLLLVGCGESTHEMSDLARNSKPLPESCIEYHEIMFRKGNNVYTGKVCDTWSSASSAQ